MTIIKKYEDFFAEMKESVKDRGREIMDKKDLKEIEFGDFVVRRINPSETNEYSPVALIDALGTSASSFVTVKAGALEKWMMKSRLPFDQVEKIQAGMKVKIKKGFIGLYPKKEKKEGEGPVYIK